VLGNLAGDLDNRSCPHLAKIAARPMHRDEVVAAAASGLGERSLNRPARAAKPVDIKDVHRLGARVLCWVPAREFTGVIELLREHALGGIATPAATC
jgi:hypothetical protein